MMDSLLSLVLRAGRWMRILVHSLWLRLVVADLRRRGCTVGTHLWFGWGCRVRIARGSHVRLGEEVVFGDDCWLIVHEGDRLEVGDRCYFSQHCTVSGNVSIGKDTMCGAFVTVLDSDHAHADLTTPMRAQGVVRSPVEIGSDVWVGTGAMVLRGSRIGAHSIIGANTVVKGIVEEYSMVVGHPPRSLSRQARPEVPP